MSHADALLEKLAECNLTPYSDVRRASDAVRASSTPGDWELGVGTCVIAMLSHKTIASSILGVSCLDNPSVGIGLQSRDHWCDLDVVVRSVATIAQGVGHCVVNSVHLLLALLELDQKKCDEEVEAFRKALARRRSAGKRWQSIERFIMSLPEGTGKDLLSARAKRPRLLVGSIREELKQYINCEYYPFDCADFERCRQTTPRSETAPNILYWFAAHASIDLSR